jgi:hypothetical protein
MKLALFPFKRQSLVDIDIIGADGYNSAMVIHIIIAKAFKPLPS